MAEESETHKKALDDRVGIFLDGEYVLGAFECSVKDGWVKHFVLEFQGEERPDGFRPHILKKNDKGELEVVTSVGKVEIRSMEDYLG